ncbi:MAG TPA: LytTR family DNA-binding domain-containing protein [Chitinophagaceae bacterium]|nr:LytTR family DNA-binding domain-containing protein [Chitinophagaceae bacterium]
MTKVVIIDDELHCINRLHKLLMPAYGNMLTICGTAQTIEEAARLITIEQPDLVFLDVQIHDKTGFDLLRGLRSINFAIIFTTAYENFAIQAIKFSAIDYLLKPVDEDDLNNALLKFMDNAKQKTAVEKIDALLVNTQAGNIAPKKIIVPTVSGFEFMDVADIVRCNSDINYTTIYLKNKQKMVVAKTLKEFESMLSPYSFFRIHNSHLVNLAYIKSYNKGKGGSVLLTDGTELEVSSRRKDEFLKKLAAM